MLLHHLFRRTFQKFGKKLFVREANVSKNPPHRPYSFEAQGHGGSVRKGYLPFFHKTAAFRPTISFSPFLIKEEFALLDRGRRRRYPPRQFRCFVKADTTGCTRGPSRNPSFLSQWPLPSFSLSLPVSPPYRSSPRASGLA